MVVKSSNSCENLQIAQPNAVNQQSDDDNQRSPCIDKQVAGEGKLLFAQSDHTLKHVHTKAFARPARTRQVSEKELYLSEIGNGKVQSNPLIDQRHRRPGPSPFWLVMILICTTIVGAAMGGGVVGALSNAFKGGLGTLTPTWSVVQTTATATMNRMATAVSTSSAIPHTASLTRTCLSAAPKSTTVSSGMGQYNCPAENGTIYRTTLYPQTFEILCDTDWPEGVTGINGGRVFDLNTGVVAMSIQACVEQCSANFASGGGCSAVAYGANITLALSRRRISGNCFMKTQRGATILVDNSGQAMAAFRVSD